MTTGRGTDGRTAVVAALAALAAGRDADALRLARDAATAAPGARLPVALAAHLQQPAGPPVYGDPTAFRAFIAGGGNVPLYAATSAALGDAHRRHGATSLLDVGCGDGRALLPALAAPASTIGRVDVVEPSAAMLEACVAGLEALSRRRALTWGAHGTDAAAFLAGLPGDARWDVGELSFAGHAMAPPERAPVLAALRRRVGVLLLVEFDVPGLERGGPAHLVHLAERYEAGLAEYDGDLVPLGFLLPVLVGQLAPARTPDVWEQPAAAWAEELRGAGFAEVSVQPVADHWWAPAVLLSARGATG
jgi:SAM-dependent methyltransferase